MARVWDQVQAVLETRLQEFGGSPRDPATGRLLIAFENDRFEPLTDKAWWRAQFVPVDVGRGSSGVDGYSHINGEFVIDLFYPVGGGSGDARRDADDLVAHFKSATTLTSDDGVEVWIKSARREAAITEARWYQLQVRVHWMTVRAEI